MAKPLKTEILNEARLSLSNPVAYCGFHCDYCSHKFCGGCRSEYVGTSYKQACGGACPNITCARKKGIDGCYLCDDLKNCDIGYYVKNKEYTAKASALFIKKYGEECFTNTLKKAVESGMKYTKSFDRAGSVEKVLALLENYI